MNEQLNLKGHTERNATGEIFLSRSRGQEKQSITVKGLATLKDLLAFTTEICPQSSIIIQTTITQAAELLRSLFQQGCVILGNKVIYYGDPLELGFAPEGDVEIWTIRLSNLKSNEIMQELIKQARIETPKGTNLHATFIRPLTSNTIDVLPRNEHYASWIVKLKVELLEENKFWRAMRSISKSHLDSLPFTLSGAALAKCVLFDMATEKNLV